MSPRPTLWRRASILCALPLLALLVSSCATGGFRQAAAVNLEIRFNGWDAVFITKPNTRENGFIPVLNGPETLAAIERLNVPRGLAAVVVSSNFDEQQSLSIALEWQKQLSALGFERVVVLRGSDTIPTRGLPIAHDSAISSVNETRGLSNTYTAAPAAARADAAHPPIAAIR